MAGGVEAGVTGLAVLVAVLLLASAFGVWHVSRAGRLRPPRSQRPERPALTGNDLGGELGERATLVQFSTAFCAPCRATRQVLIHAANSVDGVRHIDIDAESHLELVSELGVTRTPTVLLIDQHGRVMQRTTGVPRLAQLTAALQQLATK
jgi:thiol-disulfide isomerase/thioredoxin